ncbi:predicted protein [Verticillium alfalfae VaMs.102]|uniref:Predicted protein n=1 Tax=Verticillium alfalfae (strain VaMs.102 / ATCC MYA-4576 / FGSC 10136) TaxID=526221 RepID=C9SK73_VERA1|nr:predicted protein [Verticillium alfalfae VaMs.102]EEY19091.1 predicted protein [Verticillium alfalfae VaMs.102]
MFSKSWTDRADRDLFFTILSVKCIGIITGPEWTSIGNSMRSMGYGFTNEGCRQHFQGLRRAQHTTRGIGLFGKPGVQEESHDPTRNPITRRPGPGRGRPRKQGSPPMRTVETSAERQRRDEREIERLSAIDAAAAANATANITSITGNPFLDRIFAMPGNRTVIYGGGGPPVRVHTREDYLELEKRKEKYNDRLLATLQARRAGNPKNPPPKPDSRYSGPAASRDTSPVTETSLVPNANPGKLPDAVSSTSSKTAWSAGDKNLPPLAPEPGPGPGPGPSTAHTPNLNSFDWYPPARSAHSRSRPSNPFASALQKENPVKASQLATTDASMSSSTRADPPAATTSRSPEDIAGPIGEPPENNFAEASSFHDSSDYSIVDPPNGHDIDTVLVPHPVALSPRPLGPSEQHKKAQPQRDNASPEKDTPGGDVIDAVGSGPGHREVEYQPDEPSPKRIRVAEPADTQGITRAEVALALAAARTAQRKMTEETLPSQQILDDEAVLALTTVHDDFTSGFPRGDAGHQVSLDGDDGLEFAYDGS